MTAAGQVSAGVHDDPDSPPPPDAEAPRGWTWNRKGKHWAPRQRGPVLWQQGGQQQNQPAPGPEPAAAAGPQQDPPPAWLRDDGKPGDRQPQQEVPQQVKDDIAGFAGLIATPVLAVIESADPYCGRALASNFESAFDATLPLLCRSQKIVRYFSSDENDWLLWGKLAIALAPVAKAVVEHHITRTVQLVEVLDEKTNEPTGEIIAVRRGQDKPEQIVPPRDFSMFPAAA